jgi:hypothetical protein
MTKKKIKRILRIAFIIASISSLFFVPWLLVKAWIHKDLDAVVIQFYNTTDPKLYMWNLSEIINNRIVKILKKQKAHNNI